MFFRGGGQRVCTVLVYLNDVATGGATRFSQLQLDVQPKQGASRRHHAHGARGVAQDGAQRVQAALLAREQLRHANRAGLRHHLQQLAGVQPIMAGRRGSDAEVEA